MGSKNVANSYVHIDIFCILSQANHYLKESEKFKKDCARLHTELEEEKKDAQSKSDEYKKNIEQFQLQWKKRKEAEAIIQVRVYQNYHELQY